MKKVIIISVAMMAMLAYCGPDKETKELADKAKQVFQPVPDKMPGSENDTQALITLGKKLYFETKLSKNDSQSCNSCHRVDEGLGGDDGEATSPGAFGDRGGRNAPTVLNAGFQLAQFWDGRAKDLVEQAKGPILNPIEMAMPSEDEAVKKIKEIPEYKDLFDKAFKEGEDKITYQNIAEAIAAFERTLVTHDRFDDFMKGDYDALTKEEIEGLDAFMQTGCAECHNGPVLGGNSYRKMGRTKPYETKDLGRYEVTKKEADKYFFKVSMLRNVAITGPYFHDGSIKTLDEAVKKMAWHQLGKELDDATTQKIVTFLGALTGKDRKE